MNLDVIIVVTYFVLLIVCGSAGMYFAKNSTDFMVAGRNLRFWMYFPCLSTVIIGGGATFGAATLSYKHGISGAWLTVMFGLGIMTMGALLSSKLSRLRVVSISEMLEKRYASGSRYVSAFISVVYTTLLSVVQVIAMGTVLHSFLGWDTTTAMLVGGTISLLYTLLGGMWSIAIVDLLQFLLMLVGVFVFLVPYCVGAAGGVDAMVQAVPASFIDPVGIGWGQLLMYFLLMYLGIMIGQDIWQRIFTAKNQAVAKAGTLSAGIFSIFWGMAMAVCGITAFILFPQIEPQLALSKVVVEVMPVGLKGMVIAALLSALMSSASGQTLAAATLMVNDLIKPFSSAITPKTELLYSRLITGATGLCVLVLAVTINDVLAALDIAYALLSGCVFTPVVAGFFWPRATAKGAFASMALSLVVTVVCIWQYGAFSAVTISMGLLASTVGLVAGSLLMVPNSDEQTKAWEDSISAIE